MPTRITNADLYRIQRMLNEETNNPTEYMTEGNGHCAVGHYHFDHAYGGTKLVQTVNEGGGIRQLQSSYATKREAYEYASALLDGIRIGKKLRD